MKMLKKFVVVASVLTIALTVLAGCGEDPVVAYNNQVSAAYTSISDSVGKMLDDLSTELDKDPGKADFAKLDAILEEGSATAKAGIATIRTLKVPDAPGVKAFDDTLKAFVSSVEGMLTLNDQFVAAIKAGDKVKVDDLSQKLLASFQGISKQIDKVIAAQEDMAKQNNITLE